MKIIRVDENKIILSLMIPSQLSFIEPVSDNNASIYLPIIIGVIAGVLASGLVELLRFWYNKLFSPWLISINYDEIDLTGVWEEKYVPLDPNEEKQIQNISLEFIQKAHLLTGIGILTTNNHVKQEYKTRRMIIKGTVKNRYVSIHLELDNPQRFGIVNYLLEITSEGDTMKGYTNYYDPFIRDLNTAECTLVRRYK